MNEICRDSGKNTIYAVQVSVNQLQLRASRRRLLGFSFIESFFALFCYL